MYGKPLPPRLLRGTTPAERPFPVPPLESRSFQPRRVWQLMREIRQDPSQTDKAFEMFEAIGGKGDDGLFRSFAATEEGQRLLAERPDLPGLLADRSALGAMAPGSFGRAYLDFALENGFAADSLLQTRDSVLDELNADLDPHRELFFDRLTVMHDLWHVLTSYGTDRAGEITLLGFSWAQGMRSRAFAIFSVVGATMGGFPLQRAWWQALRRGQRANALVVARYEELLPLPIEDVRTRLRIAPVFVSHPEGVLRHQDDALVRVAA
jgi:ubiquinone biosynthesis protein COQ4